MLSAVADARTAGNWLRVQLLRSADAGFATADMVEAECDGGVEGWEVRDGAGLLVKLLADANLLGGAASRP